MFSLFLTCLLLPADAAPVKTPRDALQQLQSLIGTWKANGSPEGTREQKEKGLWSERIEAVWKFDKDDVRFHLTWKDGKHFTEADLRWIADKAHFELTTKNPKNETRKYTGKTTLGAQKETILTLDSPSEAEIHRLVFTFLHANRILYRAETQAAGTTKFVKQYQVGATKEGEPFAVVPKGNECIVSGGKGTIAVNHMGKTYYVCCSGCKDAFLDDPQKFIDAAAAEKKKD
ncbi:MAG: hypothetical protein ACRC8S_04380 [Fimbriiglobus sp.]